MAQPRRTRRHLRRYLSTWVDWNSLCDPKSSDAGDLRDFLGYRTAWADAITGLLREHDVAAPAEEEAESPSDRQPEPGPILHKDDLQKGRWGGATERDGRVVRAVLESVDRDVFYFSLIVESVDGSPLRLRPHARGPSTNSLALLPLETHLTLLGSTSWPSNSRPVSIRYG